MKHRTSEAIHEAHQAVELAASAITQLHNAASADDSVEGRLVMLVLTPIIPNIHNMGLVFARLALDVTPEQVAL